LPALVAYLRYDATQSPYPGCQTSVNSPANPGKHSSIQESARLAEEAGAKMFCPVHGPPDQIEQCHKEAKKYYHGNIYWPRALERLVVSL
jgi:ribonuclease BN (tRNA processing enzyme)